MIRFSRSGVTIDSNSGSSSLRLAALRWPMDSANAGRLAMNQSTRLRKSVSVENTVGSSTAEA